VEGGLESLISRTGVRFSPAVTWGLLRPFPLRMHRRQRRRVLVECPHWKASSQTRFQACCPINVHFQEPGHRLACLSTARCPLGSPPSPVCRPIQGPPHVQGPAKTVSIDRLKPAYVLHVDTESDSPPAIPSGLTTRSEQRVRFLDYMGVQWSQRGVGGLWTLRASQPT